VVEEEADESAYWMELLVKGRLVEKDDILDLLKEANEIVAIMASSRKSAAEALQSQIGLRKSQIK
jgi:hypothetical protein